MKDKSSGHSRRSFLRLGLGLAAASPLSLSGGCGGGSSGQQNPPPQPRSDAKVAIVRCNTYDPQALENSVGQAFTSLGGIGALVNGKTVTVKINLTSDGTYHDQFGRPAVESYITHGATAMALARLLLAAGAYKVRFVDSVPFLLPLDQVLTPVTGWDVPGMLALGNVEFENTRNLGTGSQYARLNVSGTGNLFSYFQLNHCYQDTDVFISLAKLKQHLTAGVTLSMKNVFGSTPNALYGADAGSEDAISWRGPLHGNGTADWVGINPPGAKTNTPPVDAGSRIPRIVADINAARPVHLGIIDGIMSMSGGEGPWAPNAAPTSPGILIAGLNAVSTDAVGVAVMGYANPRANRGTPPFAGCDNHLLLAEQNGIGTADLSQIDVRGLTISQVLYPYPQALLRPMHAKCPRQGTREMGARQAPTQARRG